MYRRLGDVWHRLDGAGLPQPRLRAGLTFDPIGQRNVLYGGLVGAQWRSDTLQWRVPGGWSTLTLTDTGDGEPSLNVKAFLFFDTVSQAVTSLHHREMWTLGADEWLAHPASQTGPLVHLYNYGFAYDEVAGEGVLYGGNDASNGSQYSDETWVWSSLAQSWEIVDTTACEVQLFAARGNELVFDESRGRVLMRASIVPVGAQVAVEWDGACWHEVPLSDPLGDGAPPFRSGAGWIDVGGHTEMLGGTGSGQSWEADYTPWALHNADTRPALTFTVDTRAAQLPDDASVVAVDVVADARGASEVNGALAGGVELQLWWNGRWRKVDESAEIVLAGLGTQVTQPIDLALLLPGKRAPLRVAVTTPGTRGQGDAYIELDYVELTARYRLPAAP
jgi:hypothetical protein